MFRHQALELIANPSKKYCIPCRTVFPYATSQEMEEFQLHSQEHNIKKEDSAGLLSCTGSVKCSKLFQTQEALTEHVAKSHDKSVKGDGSYCDTCGKFLPNVHRLKKHHDAHHRQIKCKICGVSFPGTYKYFDLLSFARIKLIFVFGKVRLALRLIEIVSIPNSYLALTATNCYPPKSSLNIT